MLSPTPPLPIEVILTETALARDFLGALSRRDIPEKYFYWFPLSVRAWLALCERGSSAGGYRNADRSRELVARHAREIAERTGPGAIEVISLGAGQGDKDRLVLCALAAAGRAVRYRPVDASIGLLEIAVHDALAEGHATVGIKADFTDAEQLERIGSELATPSVARLLLVLGNTLGAFDPAALALRLASLMRPGDVAVVDGELFAGAETLAGYDNPTNRRFAFAPLEAAGLTTDDGDLEFSIACDEHRPGLYRVEKRFTLRRDAWLRVAGESIPLRAGEQLAMSPSHKYSEAGFLAVLRGANLEPVLIRSSEDGRFMMAVVGQARETNGSQSQEGGE